MTIYFCTVKFDRQVHAQALGFTWYYYPFVMAPNPALAEQAAREFYRRKYDLGVVSFKCTSACHQNESQYVFPEQIIRYNPAEAAEAAQLTNALAAVAANA